MVRPSGARDIARTAVEGLVAKAQAAGETGWGVFGVELFVLTDGSILFNEVSPRPHDTGMVTMASQRLSEFALHARAILGLPITPEHVSLTIPAGSVAASHAIVVAGDGEVEFTDVAAALAEPGTDLRIFAKPEVHGHRRMAVGTGRRRVRSRRPCQGRPRGRCVDDYRGVVHGLISSAWPQYYCRPGRG